MKTPTPDHNGDPADAQDTNKNGTLDYLDKDDDGDGVLTMYEKPDPNRDGNPADARDTDKNGKPDYLDADDDGDKILSKNEQADLNADANPADAVDTDKDGIPDYLDADSHPATPNDNPKPITLVSFNALWQTEGVQIRWETSSETNVFGFRLYRSLDADLSNALLITPEVITSQGLNGGVYSFTDRFATAGINYHYWLEEVASDGGTNTVDSGVALGKNPNNLIFLPLINTR